MKMFRNLISAIYPNKCIACGEIIEEEKSLCDLCDKHIERNDVVTMCLRCGYEQKDCVCNLNVYRFSSLISAFKNDGVAQKAYYKYKFNKKQHYAHFFAHEMSNLVEQLYKDIKFDCVCSVPTGRKFFNNTHYDHCAYITELISEELQIPYLKNILYCKRFKKLQHKSTIKERLINVNDKYDYNFKIDGKTVLLVDDIRTTGATLDECTKMLLYAGAENVLCVTALATKFKSKKEN